MDNQTIALEPCPFCRGRAVMRQDDEPTFYVTFDHAGDCPLYAVPADIFPCFATANEASAAWALRTPAPSPVSVGGDVVAWMYTYPGAFPSVRMDRAPYETTWTETPLYAALQAHPAQAQGDGVVELIHELNNLPMVSKGSQFDGWLLSEATLKSILAAMQQQAPVKLDWRAIAKAAGEHGVRYRTNTALEKFLAAIQSKPTDEGASE